MLITSRKEEDVVKFFKGNTYVGWLGPDGEFRKIISNASLYVGMNYSEQDAKNWLLKDARR